MQNIEQLENLPFRASSRQASDYDSWDCYRTSNIYVRTKRFLEKNVGQDVDVVFSKLRNMSKTDKDYKKALKPYNLEYVWSWFFSPRWNFPDFVVDDKNILHKVEHKRKMRHQKVVVDPGEIIAYKWNGRLNHFSPIFREKLGHELFDRMLVSEIPINVFNRIDWYPIKQKIPNYVHIEVGFDACYANRIEVYKGEKDYQKLRCELNDATRKHERMVQKEKEEKLQTLLSDILRQKKAKERETNLITRDRLGFDENSFKGEFYHGQKRKKKKEKNG